MAKYKQKFRVPAGILREWGKDKVLKADRIDACTIELTFTAAHERQAWAIAKNMAETHGWAAAGQPVKKLF